MFINLLQHENQRHLSHRLRVQRTLSRCPSQQHPTDLIINQTYAIKAPIAGYGVAELEWEFDTTDGSGPISVNGTIQEVQTFLEVEKPTLATAFIPDDKASLAKRTAFSRSDVVCNNFPAASSGVVAEAIRHLRGVSGKPKNGLGPGNCGRVSCDYKAAIWWCNDVSSVYPWFGSRCPSSNLLPLLHTHFVLKPG